MKFPVFRRKNPLNQRRRQSAKAGIFTQALESRALLSGVYEFEPIGTFNPTVLNDVAYYTSFDRGYHLTTLGVDGIETVTQMTTGAASSDNPPFIANLNGVLLFPAVSETEGVELFRSDGTVAGTQLVKNINAVSGVSAFTQTNRATAAVFKDKLYFVANDGIHGNELWVSDGTEQGTSLVKDIWPSVAASLPTNLIVSGDNLFFTANSPNEGSELWMTDGTEGGTQKVDITPGNGSTVLGLVRPFEDGLVFTVPSTQTLYSVDGDGNLNQIISGVDIDDAYGFNGDVYFIFDNTGVWVKKPNQALDRAFTTPHGDAGFEGRFHGVLNDRLIFSHGESQGNNVEFSLYSTDGMFVEEFHPGYGFQSQGIPDQPFGELNGEWFYRAQTQSNGVELWASDGTTLGTRLVKDIRTGTQSSQIREFAAFDNRLYFLALNDNDNEVIWSTNGTAAGTVVENDQYGFHQGLFATDMGVFSSRPVRLEVEESFIGPIQRILINGDTLDAPQVQTPVGNLVSWNPVADADSYEYTSLVITEFGIESVGQILQTTEISFEPQHFGLYRYAVRSVKGNLRSDWSTVEYQATPAPNLVTPVPDGLVDPIIFPEGGLTIFEWEDLFQQFVPQGQGIELEVYSNVDPTQLIASEITSDDSLRLQLDPGAYQYRTRANAFDQTSAWTERRTFHVLADRAKMITPFSAQNESRPTFRWVAVEDTSNLFDVTYEVLANNLTTGERMVVSVTGLETTSYTPDFDLPAGEYNAWVLPNVRNREAFNWSDPIRFSVGMTVTNLSPEGQIGDSRPTLSWDAVDGDVTYEVWGNRLGLEPRAIYAADLDSNNYVPPADLVDGLYRFWVRAHFSNGQATEWSQHTDFTVGDPVIPEITSPSNSTADSTPTFTWIAPPNATNYRLHIENRDTGETTVISENDIATNSHTLNQDLADGRYFAWVRGFANGETATGWSPSQAFSIGEFPVLFGPDPVIAASTYVNFGHEGYEGGDIVEFDWTAVAGAERYEFFMQHVQGRTRAMHDTDIVGTSIAPTYNLPTGTYRAWIRALFDDGTKSRWSERVEFTIA